VTTDNVNSHDGSLKSSYYKTRTATAKNGKKQNFPPTSLSSKGESGRNFFAPKLPATCNKGTLYEINESMHLIFHECSSVVCMLLKETVV